MVQYARMQMAFQQVGMNAGGYESICRLIQACGMHVGRARERG